MREIRAGLSFEDIDDLKLDGGTPAVDDKNPHIRLFFRKLSTE